jgi:hypothetical protein
MKGGQLAYVFEYVVHKGESFNQHSVSVIMAREETNTLFTLTAICPDEKWDARKDTIFKIAESFQLFE